MKLIQITGLMMICISISLCQDAKLSNADHAVALRVSGEVSHPLSLTFSELSKLPHRTVHAQDHGGEEYDFEGIELFEILRLAGVEFGGGMKGKTYATTYLVAEATDSYKVVFAFSELDTSFTNRPVILADRRDHSALPTTDGPLRIIMQGEKRHARWIRQVKSFTVRRAN